MTCFNTELYNDGLGARGNLGESQKLGDEILGSLEDLTRCSRW